MQFVLLTLDDWGPAMTQLQDAWASAASMWFVLFTFFTVNIVFNLMLTNITESFSQERERALLTVQTAEEIKEDRKAHLTRCQ